MSDRERHRLTLLYVEDEEETRETMVRILARRFDHVIAVRDVSEALAAFATDRPDLVVTDIQLPGLDGWTFLEHVQKTGCGVPVIVTTAFEVSAYQQRLEAYDVAAALMKPIDLDGLQSALLECVRRIGRQRRDA